MEKYNFDVIFSGSMEEQERKATYFAEGVRVQLKDFKSAYASYVLSNEPDRAGRTLQQVENWVEGHKALVADPRGAALKRWIDERDAERAAHLIVDAVLGRKTENQQKQ